MIHPELRDKLRHVTSGLLDETRVFSSLRSEVLELGAIFQSAGGFHRPDQQDIATGETRTAGGVAISPTMASMCLDDFARTVQFIRGVRSAIEDLHRDVERPVRVLYAGCGPWAPLAVPLMSVLDSERVRFTLLDMHEESIRSVEHIVRSLELDECVERFEVADAAAYAVGAIPPDLIVIEMLRSALDAEPQVAVVRHLSRQAPRALIIPEQVRVDLVLVNPAREHSIDERPPERDRIFVATVFKLDREIAKDPVYVTLPDFDPESYRPMLLTTVDVYGGTRLSDYDSGITLPKRMRTEIGAGNTVEFVYEIGVDPGISTRVVD